MRLEGKHAEQHARSGIRIVELDRATLLLRPQPVRQSILGPRDRSAIKGLRNIRKLVAVGKDDALKRDHITVEHQLRANQQRLRERRLDIAAVAGAQFATEMKPSVRSVTIASNSAALFGTRR
jgi:fumarylacetoacetate (FAA) hydrolase family protein